jgi:hypothetical protein
MKGQGAIECCSGSTAGAMLAQGATEYLVLLAVVLTVALVSVALLGFFPGMASDSQIAQSSAYWQSTSPIAVTEWGARYYNVTSTMQMTVPYFRIRNTGSYPITITKMLAGNESISYIWTGDWFPTALMSDRCALAPGEESYFGYPMFGIPDPGYGNRRFVSFSNLGMDDIYDANFPSGAAKSYCSQGLPYGFFIIENFGFEYTTTIEGQTITKREVGAKSVMIKCRENYN